MWILASKIDWTNRQAYVIYYVYIHMKTVITALIVLVIIVGGFLLLKEKSGSIVDINNSPNTSTTTNLSDGDDNQGSSSVKDSTYNNVTQGISFVYPSTFSLTDSFIAEAATVWRTNSTSTGVRVAEVRTPANYLSSTNFNGAWLHVGYTTNANEVKNCLRPDNETSSGAANINGVTFTKFTAQGAAAGNRYDTTSYRTVRSNRCYAVEYTIHYGNIQNYDQNSGIKEFDESAVTSTFEAIAKSFKFTK